MSAALKFACASAKSAKTETSETRVLRDPHIQEGWDLAKEFTAYSLMNRALLPLLRQMKDGADSFIYPKSEPISEDPYVRAEFLKEALYQTGKDKMNAQMWSSYETLCSQEMSAPYWDTNLPYPEHKGSSIEFHSVGALGSNETRKIINEKILPELGLGDFMFRSYPGFEFWNKKKHSASQRGSFGRLVGPDGESIPATRMEQGKKIRRYDISLVRKASETHQTKQKIRFSSNNSCESDSDE